MKNMNIDTMNLQKISNEERVALYVKRKVEKIKNETLQELKNILYDIENINY